MLNRIMIFAALAAAAFPHAAAAADYYDGGQRPLAFQSRDDVEIDDDRVAPGRDLRPTVRGHFGGDRPFPGPVVFDERDPGHGGPAYGYGRPAYGYGGPVYGARGPVVVERPLYGDAGPAYAPRFDRPDLPAYGGRYGSPYRPASLDRDAGGAGFAERPGYPDVGCTVEEARSTTPAGWRKVVTYRTCYRR